MEHCLAIGLLLGVLFYAVANFIVEIISAWTEFIKAKISVKIVECNVKIDKLNSSLEKQNTHVIGFQIPDEKEDYEDDDYDNE